MWSHADRRKNIARKSCNAAVFPRKCRYFHCGIYAMCVGLITAVSDAIDYPGSLERCPQVSDVISRVPNGWPYQVNCQGLIPATEYFYAGPFPEADEYQCEVSSGGRVVHQANISVPGDSLYVYDVVHEPYLIPSVSEDDNGTIFISTLTGEEKCSASFTLFVEELDEKSCKEAALEIKNTTRELMAGHVFVLSCLTDRHSFSLVSQNYVVTWYKDCRKIKSKTKVGIDIAEENVEVDRLQISEVNFNTTPGEYTCSVTYNGYEKYLYKSNVCVKYAASTASPSIRHITPTEVAESVGNDVTMTCGGFAYGVSQISVAIFWIRNSTNGTQETICREYLIGQGGDPDTDGKYRCNLLSNVGEISTCYSDYQDAMTDRYKGVLRLNSSLTIRNFQATDAGEYICHFISTRPTESIAFTVHIKSLSRLIIILSVVIGVLALIFTAFVLYLCIRRRNLKKESEGYLDNSSSVSESNDSKARCEEPRKTEVPESGHEKEKTLAV